MRSFLLERQKCSSVFCSQVFTLESFSCLWVFMPCCQGMVVNRKQIITLIKPAKICSHVKTVQALKIPRDLDLESSACKAAEF